jgi:hypothetical protein
MVARVVTEGIAVMRRRAEFALAHRKPVILFGVAVIVVGCLASGRAFAGGPDLVANFGLPAVHWGLGRSALASS